ncbi:hypothetical protein NE237_022157 [Protea cynaroides]|uniref:Uncharacterized protein n=1 Tax=Protea cynaroides TaxID=273540 RepID=A0A9Q0H9V3_9MAGN|nr:hypothetical protein NE237_022157 [Protea cynaroides]
MVGITLSFLYEGYQSGIPLGLGDKASGGGKGYGRGSGGGISWSLGSTLAGNGGETYCFSAGRVHARNSDEVADRLHQRDMVGLPFMVAQSEGRFINQSKGSVPNGSWNNSDRSQSGSRDSGVSAFRGGRVQPGNPFLGNGGNLDQGLMPQSHQVGMAIGSSAQAGMPTITTVASSSGNNDLLHFGLSLSATQTKSDEGD